MEQTPPLFTTKQTETDSETEEIIGDRKRKRIVNSPENLEAVTYSNQNEVLAMLTSWKTQQESLLAQLISDVADIKTEVKKIQKSNTEIEKTLEFVCKNYEELNGKVESLEKECNEKNGRIDKLEEKIEELERNARNTCIEIRGIPAKPNEAKSDLLSIIDNIHNKIKTEVEHSFIRNIYRAKGKPGGDRPIILDVTTPFKKYNILKAVKEYNYHHIGDRLNTAAIGLEGKKSPIFISDFLTPKAKKLFFLAREMAKDNGYKYCWSANGKIFLRKAEGLPHIIVLSEQHLEELKQKK